MCREENLEQLSESTCYKILNNCAASFRKSLCGLDNVISDGLDGFDEIEKIIPILEENGLESENAKTIAGSNNDVISNDYELAIALMLGVDGNADSSLVTVPASGFGVNKEDLVLRISFSSERKNLEKMIEKLHLINKLI